MDEQAFLHCLLDLSLEEGHIYIQDHSAELSAHVSMSTHIADEARRQRDISPSVSLKLAELLIFLGKHTGHTLSLTLGLKAKGSILNYFEQHQAAMEYLDEAGEEFLRMGDEVNWAYTRVPWIVSCAWTGQIELALQTSVQAHDILLKYDERYKASLLDHNTAVIYSQMGQYKKALEVYERLLVLYPTLKDQSEALIERSMANVEVNKARNLSWLGDFEQAYALLEKAQRKFIALGQTSVVIWTETNLADLDYIQGYYGVALRRYYRARDRLMHEKIEHLSMLTSITLRMATCLVKLNRNDEAYQWAVEAVEACQRLGVSLTTGYVLREYATILVASGRVEEALVALDQAHVLFTQDRFEHHAATTNLQRAELLLLNGAIAEAYEQARQVKEYFDAQNLVSRSVRADLVMATSLITSAWLLESSREKEQKVVIVQQATDLCNTVTLLARRHKLHEEIYRAQHLLGQLAIIRGDLKRASRHYNVAINRIEHILDGLVYDLGPAFLRTTWNVYEDMIDLCLQRGRADYALSYLERARSMALHQYLNKSRKSVDGSKEEEGNDAPSSLQESNAILLRMQHQMSFWQEKYHDCSALLAKIDVEVVPGFDREVLQAELKQCETRLSELFERVQLYELDVQTSASTSRFRGGEKRQRATNSIDVNDLRRHLAADQLLLVYFLSKGKIIIITLTADHLAIHEIPDGIERLEMLLPILHARLSPEGWPDPQHPPLHVARRLLQKLHTLLIEPVASLLPSGGHITIVPFGPLHNLPFHALYNGSRFLIEDFQISYLPAASMLAQTHPHEERYVQAGGDVIKRHPVIFGYSGKQQLLMAVEEAKVLAAMLQGDCYLEEEATIAHLHEKAVESSIMHIATHGKSRLDAPNFSSLLLADGQLNAIDAFHLDLRGCELVTLSGCETGLSLSGGGDEQLGLSRAFLAAGASSLVMSLWPVEDTATSELMQLFYEHLCSGTSKMQALRAAQCDLLRRDTFHASPYFWAAFRLIGDTGPLYSTIEPLKK